MSGIVGDEQPTRAPLGKRTSTVCSQSGAESGMCFWKNGLAPAPSTKRFSVVGRPRRWTSTASATLR